MFASLLQYADDSLNTWQPDWQFYVGAIFACGVVGLLIGSTKGRALEGMLVGGLLGPLGLIIVACRGKTDAKRLEEMAHQQALQAQFQHPTTPPGWYVDPSCNRYRWHDGTQFTEHYA